MNNQPNKTLTISESNTFQILSDKIKLVTETVSPHSWFSWNQELKPAFILKHLKVFESSQNWHFYKASTRCVSPINLPPTWGNYPGNRNAKPERKVHFLWGGKTKEIVRNVEPEKQEKSQYSREEQRRGWKWVTTGKFLCSGLGVQRVPGHICYWCHCQQCLFIGLWTGGMKEFIIFRVYNSCVYPNQTDSNS